MGFEPLEMPLQIDSINNSLKTRLWNVFQECFISRIPSMSTGSIAPRAFYRKVWDDFFNMDLDRLTPNHEYGAVSKQIKEYFFSINGAWYKPYQIMEYCVAQYPFNSNLLELHEKVNKVMEQEFGAFRMIMGKFAPITNSHEIQEIAEALNASSKFTMLEPCNIHLSASLSKLSDKSKPDYRNSIKESISAIEALVKIITNQPKATLGTALEKVKDSANVHSALIEGFKKLYGYTSDAHGIRHGLIDQDTCDFDDAKYMLVSISAFINYLISKSQKSGLLILA